MSPSAELMSADGKATLPHCRPKGSQRERSLKLQKAVCSLVWDSGSEEGASPQDSQPREPIMQAPSGQPALPACEHAAQEAAELMPAPGMSMWLQSGHSARWQLHGLPAAKPLTCPVVL